MGVFINPQVRVPRHRSYRPMSEINVTPMVDVMLVLLIIFIVAAPLLTTGVEVNLPESKTPNLPQDNEALTVSVQKDGSIWLQDTELELRQLGPRLQAITEANRDVRVYIRGDEEIGYGRVMEVMSAIYSAGFRNAALVTQPPSG